MADEQEKTLQDIMSQDLFSSSKGEMVETLQFMEKHAVPLSQEQLAAIALLQFLDTKRGGKKLYSIFTNTVINHAKDLAKPAVFMDVIDSLTLANRIRGNVRLNSIFRGDNSK